VRSDDQITVSSGCIACDLGLKHDTEWQKIAHLAGLRAPICDPDFERLYPKTTPIRVRIPQPEEPPYVLASEPCHLCGQPTRGIYIRRNTPTT